MTQVVLAMLPLVLSCTGTSPEPNPTGWVFEAQERFTLPGQVTDMLLVDGNLLVLDRRGQIATYDFAEGNELAQFEVDVYEDQACGLISATLDPDFETNRFFYYGACTSQLRSAVFRGTLAPDYSGLTDVVEIVAGEEPDAERPWHNVGWMEFDGEGSLFVLFGDKREPSNGQDTSNILGSVIRILPSKEVGVGGYTAHPDNPLVGMADRDAAIYAWGFRSPWTGGFDAANRLWVADVGSAEEGFEEVNLVQSGTNYGWSIYEGICKECAGTQPPLAAWPHVFGHPYFDEDEEILASNLRVGWVFEGKRNSVDPYDGRLADRVLFGDLCLGFIRTLQVDDAGEVIADEHLGHLPAAAWFEGPDGYLYASTLDGCSGRTLGDESDLFRLTWVDPR